MYGRVLKGGGALEHSKGKVAFCQSFTFSFHAVYIRDTTHEQSRRCQMERPLHSLKRIAIQAHHQYSTLHHKNRCVQLAYQVLNFARVWRFPIADSRHRKRAAASQDGPLFKAQKNVIHYVFKNPLEQAPAATPEPKANSDSRMSQNGQV